MRKQMKFLYFKVVLIVSFCLPSRVLSIFGLNCSNIEVYIVGLL